MVQKVTTDLTQFLSYKNGVNMFISKVESFHKITSISRGCSAISRASGALGNDGLVSILIENLKAELAATRLPKKHNINSEDLQKINLFITAEIWRILDDSPFVKNRTCEDVGVAFGASYSVTDECKTSQFVIEIDGKEKHINVNVRVAFPNGKYTSWSLNKLMSATHLDFISQYWD